MLAIGGPLHHAIRFLDPDASVGDLPLGTYSGKRGDIDLIAAGFVRKVSQPLVVRGRAAVLFGIGTIEQGNDFVIALQVHVINVPARLRVLLRDEKVSAITRKAGDGEETAGLLENLFLFAGGSQPAAHESGDKTTAAAYEDTIAVSGHDAVLFEFSVAGEASYGFVLHVCQPQTVATSIDVGAGDDC